MRELSKASASRQYRLRVVTQLLREARSAYERIERDQLRKFRQDDLEANLRERKVEQEAGKGRRRSQSSPQQHTHLFVSPGVSYEGECEEGKTKNEP